MERLVGALPGPYMHHLIYTYKNDVRTYVTRSSWYVVLELSPAQLGVPCARTVRQPGGALSLCAPARPPESLPAILSMATTGHRHAACRPVCCAHARLYSAKSSEAKAYIHTRIHIHGSDGWTPRPAVCWTLRANNRRALALLVFGTEETRSTTRGSGNVTFPAGRRRLPWPPTSPHVRRRWLAAGYRQRRRGSEAARPCTR